MNLTRQKTEYLRFPPGQAAEITGVNTALQRHWRRRGLLPDLIDGKHPRFLPGELLRIFVMRHFTEANIGIKNTQAFTTAAKDTANALLLTMPGVVKIIADTALGADFEKRERERIAAWSHMRRGYRYLVIPLPEREDTPGAPALYQRETLSDLPTLFGEDAPITLTLDCEAIARAFLARVRRITDAPLETWTFTLEREG